ncbi:MAG: NrsF family protein [Burkholderiales bacterium]
MNTDGLIRMLATNVEPVDARAATRRYVAAIAVGLVGAVALLVLLLGVRQQWPEDVQLARFLGRLLFLGLLFAAAWFACARLSRPGASLAWVRVTLAAPLLGIWMVAALMLAQAAPAERELLLFGGSWRACPFYIALFSVPVFIAAFWGMQGFAPTRLRAAGAAAGLLAGVSGALVYTLYCPEIAPPFVGIWYVLGMSIPAVLGAALGPRWLRW